MSPAEALVIYLAAGAPFGVLVLFSQKSAPVHFAIFHSVMATAAWPIFGTYRLYRGLFRTRDRRLPAHPARDTVEVLQRLLHENPGEVAELFSIAGHSNPWVATNCYARARKKVIASHIERASRPAIKFTHPPEPIESKEMDSRRVAAPIGT